MYEIEINEQFESLVEKISHLVIFRGHLCLTSRSGNAYKLVQVGNGIELEAVGLQFEPYRWRPCGVT